MEPTTITSAALAIGKLAYEGIMSNRIDGLFCQYGNSIIKSISKNLHVPQNHDILKAVRRAYLNSTLMVCRNVAKKYKVWNNFTSKAPANLREINQYLKQQLKALENDTPSSLSLLIAEDIDLLLKPKGVTTKESIAEAALNQKLLMIEELKGAGLNWVEKDIQDVIMHGWKEGDNEVDWYELVCAFFSEELKTNTRLSTIIQTEYLSEIDSKTTIFHENIEKYIHHYKEVLPKINEVLELLEINKHEIISAVSLGNENILKHLDQLKTQIASVGGASPKVPIFDDQLLASLPISRDSKDLGLEMLKYANGQAKYLYENKVYGNTKTFFNEYVWDEIFSAADFQSQKEFVETITQDNQDVKYYTLQSLAESQHRIWLLGEAGVGKTTTLYNIFFTLLISPQSAVIPMLIQPQEFDSADINIFKTTNNIIESLIIIWLQNRGFLTKELKEESDLKAYRNDKQLQGIIKRIERGLRNGEILVLIDSFDELSRMSFQVEVFKKIFQVSKKYICASRPETYLQHLHKHTSVKIRSPWALPTIKKYLKQKEELPNKWKSLIYKFVETNESIEWLKNPRYLNLLIDLIHHNHRNASEKFGEKEILGFLSNGEYALFHKIFDASFERIKRYLKLNNIHADKNKVEHLLTKIAIGQLQDGNYLLLDTHKDADRFYWQAVLTESSLIRRKTRTAANDGEFISLLNHNLVDYYISDDISKQILDASLDSHNISFNQLWTNNLLKYISQYIWEKCQEKKLNSPEVIEVIWKKLQQLKLPNQSLALGYRKAKSIVDFQTQFQALNLIQLLIQFENDRIAKENNHTKSTNIRTLIQFKHRTNFPDLNLANADFNSIYFKNCDFSRSILSNSNLVNTKFEDCTFLDTNFKTANAEGAIFENCQFNFQAYKEDSPIEKLKIKGASIKGCQFHNSPQALTTAIFLEYGAINLGSRYASKFGKDFLKNQKKYLGDGLRKAEFYYMYNAVLPILEQLSIDNKELLLIDLMAGGNNDRITSLFKSTPALSILAIDKHTEQLKSVQATIGHRFKVVKKEISGNVNLENMIQDLFNTTLQKFSAYLGFYSLRNKADIIIGKKAIHEIGKKAQIELLQNCFDTLKHSGKLVLFTDSPVSISENGYIELTRLKKTVWSSDIKRIQSELIDKLEFSDSYDDAAIFSNLWVLLKDWANDNKKEVQKRYFSSIAEIIKWSEKIGFTLTKEPFQEHYDLTAKFFNEYAFNQIELLLDRTQEDQLSYTNKHLIYEYLQGTDKHQIFFDFAEKHLFKNHRTSELTPLGKLLSAKRIELSDKFREVNPKLENIKLPYNTGVSFKFSVHVIELVKKP